MYIYSLYLKLQALQIGKFFSEECISVNIKTIYVRVGLPSLPKLCANSLLLQYY
jgi:hypothetical protein